MVFKFVDLDGQTHHIECTACTYLGSAEDGYARACGVDGEVPCLYDLVPEPWPAERHLPARVYFTVTPPTLGAARLTLGSHMQGAWLLNDRGRTIENMLMLPEPAPLSDAERESMETFRHRVGVPAAQRY